MTTSPFINEDDMTTRLFNAVSQIVVDRRQLKDDLQEHRKQIELSERKIRESADEYKQIAYQLQNKDAELERQQRLLLDNQYKYDKLQEDYQQLMITRSSEYERLQQHIRDLQQKYETLSTDYAKLRKHSSSETERLETALRNAEGLNTQLVTEVEEVRKENANLTHRITEFARQISSMLGQTPVIEPNVTPVPIRPVLSSVPEDTGRAEA